MYIESSEIEKKGRVEKKQVKKKAPENKLKAACP